jgi:hypothetical protein
VGIRVLVWADNQNTINKSKEGYAPTETVKYANADTQILTTKRQILKTAVSAVSGLVSGSSLVETGALASLLRIYFRKIIVKNVAPNPLEK